jgi:hypothetical protein
VRVSRRRVRRGVSVLRIVNGFGTWGLGGLGCSGRGDVVVDVFLEASLYFA